MLDRTMDLIVIGGGVAGLATASRAAGAGLATARFEASLCGGLVVNVDQLDGAPGSGYHLATKLTLGNKKDGVVGIAEKVTGLRPDGETVHVDTDGGQGYAARAVVVASGAELTRLGLPSETRLTNKGVSQCAYCDGGLHKGQDVVVVGGGDSALQGALALARGCRRVYVVYRGDELTGQRHLVEAALAEDTIEPVPGFEVDEVLGTDVVRGVRLRPVAGGDPRTIRCTGVFVYIGLTPNTGFVPDDVRRDAAGRLVTDPACRTDLARVLVAGAARSGNGGQLADAFADADTAVASVVSMLSGA